MQNLHEQYASFQFIILCEDIDTHWYGVTLGGMALHERLSKFLAKKG